MPSELELDLATDERRSALLDGQRATLDSMAAGASLGDSLSILLRAIETQASGMACSVLLLDRDGLHVRHCAAPNLPAEYIAAIDGLPIGDRAGSCGTAAFRKQPVFVADIATDPLWAEYAAIALRHGLRACWSTPILDGRGDVLGTFAMYYREPGLPSAEHRILIDIATNIAAVAIIQARSQQALRRSEQRYRKLIESNATGVMVASDDGLISEANDRLLQMLGASRADLEQGRLHWDALTAPGWEGVTQRAIEQFRATGICPPFEKEYLHRDGHRVPIRVTIVMSDATSNGAVCLVEDLTTHKQAEEALRHGKQRLRIIVENSPAAIAMLDREMRYLVVSQRWLTDYGLADQDLIGRSHYEVFPEISERWKEIHRRCLAGATERADMDPFPRADGHIDWVRWEIRPWHVNGGAIGGILLFTEVLTENVRRERESQQRDLRLRAMFEAEPDCVKLLAPTGELLEMNAAGLALLEADSLEQVAGRRFLKLVVPADRDAFLRLHQRVIQGGSGALEFEIVGLRGGRRRLETRAVPLRDPDGAVTALLGITRDVTALRLTEQALADRDRQLATLIDNLPGLVYRCRNDAAFTTEFVSDGIIELTGHPATAFRTHQKEFGDLVDPRDLGLVTRKVQEALGEDRPYEMTYRIISATGEQRWVWERGCGVPNADGTVEVLEGFIFDITERKRAEDRVREHAMLLDLAPNAIVVRDLGGRITYWNEGAKRLYGWTAAEAQGQLVDELLATDSKGLEALRASLMSRGEMLGEMGHRTKDGRQLTVEARARLLRDEAGVPSHVVSALTDITERKQAEARLREQAALLDVGPDAILVRELNGHITYWNAGAERLFGWSPAEAVGRNIDELLFPDATGVAALRTALLRDGEVTAEVEQTVRDGRRLIVEARARLLHGTANQPTRVLVSVTDITERKRNERRLIEQAALLDQARDAIIVRDLDYRIEFWNKGAERVFGWTAAEAIGQRIDQLLFREPSFLHAAESALLLKGERVSELENITKDGRLLIVEARATLLRDATDAPRRVMAIVTDITERRQLEQNLLRAQRLESIGTLASGIAHDLNNVLMPITMSVELLRGAVTKAEDNELLDTIAASAQRGAGLVKQVLGFARGGGDQRVAVALRPLIEETTKMLRETLPRSIEVVTRFEGEIPAVHGDATQLHQLLLNLCLNARDAMPEGGRLTIRVANAPGERVVLEVSDTGTGIEAPVLDRIFDPFFTTKPVGKGTGLGLSTSLTIVKDHQGTLDVESSANGSRFRVELPADAGIMAVEVAPPKVADPRGHGEWVLVVDDEPAILETTRRVLEASGYQVLTAADGAQALATYDGHRPEVAVVVLDMMMPVMDGATAILEFARRDPALPIIATSGVPAQSAYAHATGAKVKRFLPKPTDAATLLRALREVLDGGP